MAMQRYVLRHDMAIYDTLHDYYYNNNDYITH